MKNDAAANVAEDGQFFCGLSKCRFRPFPTVMIEISESAIIRCSPGGTCAIFDPKKPLPIPLETSPPSPPKHSWTEQFDHWFDIQRFHQENPSAFTIIATITVVSIAVSLSLFSWQRHSSVITRFFLQPIFICTILLAVCIHLFYSFAPLIGLLPSLIIFAILVLITLFGIVYRKSEARRQINFLQIEFSRTVRDRPHGFLPPDGCDAICDLCHKNAEPVRMCYACHLMCHENCGKLPVNLPCIPRPTRIFDLTRSELFNMDITELIPSTTPPIFHHIMHGILELERRKVIYSCVGLNDDAISSGAELTLKFYNSRLAPSMANADTRTIMGMINSFSLNPPQTANPILFFSALANNSQSDLEQFISSLEPIRKCTIALFGSHFKRHLQANGGDFVDEGTILSIVRGWMGIRDDNLMILQLVTGRLRDLFLAVDLGFWNRLMQCPLILSM